MSERGFYLDRGIGEDRAVVTLDGAPERLLLAREGEDPRTKMGARLVARVRHVEPALGSAFMDLGAGLEAIVQIKPDARPIRGQSLEIEIRSEPRRGKLAVARILGPAEGDPRILAPAPDLEARLRTLARGARIVEGDAARLVADEAEHEVLETLHVLPEGGDLAIETTRALTSVDIDLGERKGHDAKRVARQANLTALGMAARLLRLKSLGGLVVFDLVGRGHDGAALMTAARSAFAADNPGVAIGPITKFGTMELSIPRRTPPLREILCDDGKGPSDLTLALRLVRGLQSQARAQPGARFSCKCAPAVALVAASLGEKLAAQIGARFSIGADPGLTRERFDVAVV